MTATIRVRNLPVVIMLVLLLAGCASSESPTRSGRSWAGRPHYTVAPYQINGVWYYPRVDYAYDTTGTASWYGPGFDHRATADGEIYDMNKMSAAHKTLPLPSVVEVTNLQNGREVRLRVNDRGPFVGDRLIDVSRRAAQMLGFERSGTAPVRVRILKDESIEVAEAAMRGETGTVMVAAAPQAARTRLAAAAAPAPLRPPVAPARVAAAPPQTPASLRAAEVIAPPVAIEPPRKVVAEPAPPEPTPAGPALAAAPPKRHWPSLIASAHAETLRPPPPAKPAAAAKAGGRIFVQAGAFAVPENAQRVRARIAALGSAEVVAAAHHGAALYRVRLGPLASEAEARRLLTRVVDHGYPDARLVGE